MLENAYSYLIQVEIMTSGMRLKRHRTKIFTRVAIGKGSGPQFGKAGNMGGWGV